jgi:hypothetical protein
VGVCIGIFTGKIELPKAVEERVTERGEEIGRERAVETLRPEIQRLSLLVEQRDAILNRNIARLDLSAAEREALNKPVRLDPKVVDAALKTRIAVRPR